MKRTALWMFVALVVSPFALVAQSYSSSTSMLSAAPLAGSGVAAAAGGGGGGGGAEPGPFARLALGVGVSPLGINLSATTIANRYINIRTTGNFFNYSVNNISTNGFNATAKLSLSSAGVSADLYPFPNHGLRFSPGILFYNTNGLSATIQEQAGNSFTLNNVTYFSSATNPVSGTATVGLHSQNPAFTITTGWGNQISRKGGHLSFPVELGVAVTGTPAVNLALTSGQVCDAQGKNCQNVASYAALQSNVQAQVAKYKNDLDPLKTYPIVSVGVAYNFPIR